MEILHLHLFLIFYRLFSLLFDSFIFSILRIELHSIWISGQSINARKHTNILISIDYIFVKTYTYLMKSAACISNGHGSQRLPETPFSSGWTDATYRKSIRILPNSANHDHSGYLKKKKWKCVWIFEKVRQ